MIIKNIKKDVKVLKKWLKSGTTTKIIVIMFSGISDIYNILSHFHKVYPHKHLLIENDSIKLNYIAVIYHDACITIRPASRTVNDAFMFDAGIIYMDFKTWDNLKDMIKKEIKNNE